MGIAEKIIENQDREGMLRRSLERIIQLYTDKSHFVYELLQNAEDAGAKNIKFIQYADRLEVFHDGRPFTQANLQSLCDIGKSDNRDLKQIGEFGVGFFKSGFGICDTLSCITAQKLSRQNGRCMRIFCMRFRTSRFVNIVIRRRKRFFLTFTSVSFGLPFSGLKPG
jgi:hypothetical protein